MTPLPSHNVHYTCTLLALAAACSGSSKESAQRNVFAHVPAACAPDTSSATGVFDAYGDFESSAARTTQQRIQLRDKVELLQLPLETKALTVEITTLSDARTYRGFSTVRAREDTHVLAWPDLLEGRPACAMTGDLGTRILGASGRVGTHAFLYAGGQSPDGSNVPRSYVADLSRGRISQLPIGLSAQRLGATVTELGTGDGTSGLVAGGTDPATNRALDTGEIFDAARGDFVPTIVKLGAARADHAAVNLVNGDVLLVGGRNSTAVLRSLEVVDHKTRAARNLASVLALARVRPMALRLAAGQILVLGGTDSAGGPLPDLEWLARDGENQSAGKPLPFPASRTHAALALAGGGALIVIDADGTARANVWRLSASGVANPIGIVPFTAGEQPFLFAGSEDRALLYVQGVWYRFDPWASAGENAFTPLLSPPRGGPGPTATTVDTGEIGLVAWLDDQAKIRAFRTDLISPYHRVRGTSLQGNLRDFVPDRHVADGGFRLSDEHGLELRSGETATLAHYTFLDLDLSFSGAPEVIFRNERGDEYRIGKLQGEPREGTDSAQRSPQTRCATLWGPSSRIERRGSTVRAVSEDRQVECNLSFAPDDRVTVAFRGTGLPASWVSNVTARRP